MSYTQILRDLLDHQYPSHDQTKTIIINTLQLHLLPAPARPYFLRYEHLETLALNKCDLRNLENFPKIPTLRYLDLADNSLQGSLNHLMPLSNLSYLSISNNLIGDFRKLQPLQMIQNLEVYVVGNPFTENGEVWKNKVKQFGIKVVKEPKKIEPVVPKVKEEEEKKPQEKKEQEDIKEQPERRPHREGMRVLFRDFSDMPGHPNRLMLKTQRRMRGDLNQENPFTHGIRLMRPSDEGIQPLIFKSEQEESQELNEESEGSEDDFLNNEEEDEDLDNENNDELDPFYNVLDHDGLDINVEDDDDDRDDNSEESSE